MKCGDADDKGGRDVMLVCDNPGCGGVEHMRCDDPPLAVVPEGDWFCSPACTEAGVSPPSLRRPRVVEDCGHFSASPMTVQGILPDMRISRNPNARTLTFYQPGKNP